MHSVQHGSAINMESRRISVDGAESIQALLFLKVATISSFIRLQSPPLTLQNSAFRRATCESYVSLSSNLQSFTLMIIPAVDMPGQIKCYLMVHVQFFAIHTKLKIIS